MYREYTMPEDAPKTPPQPEAEIAPAREGQSFVSNYLLYLLAAVSHEVSGEFHAHVRAQGLRVPEWRVLATLHNEDGAMVTTLAKISLLEQSHLTKIIDQMARRGLVTRRPDPADARRVRVHLTGEGAALAARLVADARTHEAQVMSRLGPAEADAIKPALKALLARMQSEG